MVGLELGLKCLCQSPRLLPVAPCALSFNLKMLTLVSADDRLDTRSRRRRGDCSKALSINLRRASPPYYSFTRQLASRPWRVSGYRKGIGGFIAGNFTALPSTLASSGAPIWRFCRRLTLTNGQNFFFLQNQITLIHSERAIIKQ